MALICSECTTAWEEAMRPVLCQGCGGTLLWQPEHEDDEQPVSLGEGHTPVIALERWAAAHDLGEVFAKLEHLNPTGSFKDRGSAMLAGRAEALGARRLVEDSSGNAGASMAAYAARAGLRCTVYAPASAPEAKLRQAIACGAEVRRIEGDRAAVAAAAMADTAGRAYYAGHNTNPYFLHGMRTFATEVADWFAADPPEHILMPVGGGSLYAGAWLGFTALQAAGRLRRAPAMDIAQTEACAPLVRAWEQDADDTEPVTPQPSAAGGILIARPPRGPFILRALRASGGVAVAVSEQELLDVRAELAQLEGLDIEPTSAVAFAALLRMQANGTLKPEDRALIAVTGAGWKDPR